MSARRAAIAAGLAALVALAFAGALRNEFTSFDDDLYVTANPFVLAGFTLESVGRAFTSFHAGNWHPLTWLSHMTDVELFGLDPAAHHAVNVALHAANAVGVFLVLAALTGTTWRAALVAAFFAVHPLRVESVAWVAERKDLLSTAFGLLALLVWTRFARDGRPRARIAALLFFALSLAAKPMLVTLPFLLLVLDCWPLGRLRSRAELWPRVREKLGFFALALGSCLVTLAAQAPGIQVVPFAIRAANALLALPAYLSLVFWPTPLAVLYPYRTSLAFGEVPGAAGLVLAISAVALWQARRRPWLGVGWLWFVGLLVPTLGIVQVGVQAYADRYTYLPLVGVALVVVYAGAEGVERAQRRRRLASGIAAALGVLALALCVARTRAQVEIWRDTVTLFTHTLSVTRANFIAHRELGIALAARGELERARVELEEAVRIHPRYAIALANLGKLRTETGQVDEGVALLRRALAIDPKLRGGDRAIGLALEPTGRFAEAAAAYREALARDPQDRVAALQLARLLAIAPDASLRDGARAVALCELACGPGGCQKPEELDVLAMAYMEAGRSDDAVRTATRAVELARERGDAKLAAKIEGRRVSYARGEPVRVRVPAPSPVPTPSPGG
ncbi:MAG: tetratricopeptide repeat protein [Myxococcota bacterium]